MRSVHLLIKPASGMCNMRCRYCFYADETSKREISNYGVMSKKTISAVLEHALDVVTGECTIAFQGGELTLAGLDFFSVRSCGSKGEKQKPCPATFCLADQRLSHRRCVGIVFLGEPFFW